MPRFDSLDYARLRWFSVLGFMCMLPCGSTYAAPGMIMGAGHNDAIRRTMERAAADPARAGEMLDVIVETDLSSADRAKISAASGKLRYSIGKKHEVRIPAGKLQQLVENLPSTSIVRFSYPHRELAVAGQGVALTGAGDMQALGKSGVGIKVGIIDLGFASLANSQASGDLPASLSIVDYTGTGTGGANHGTQVAEIVYEMAPGGQLYLAKVGTDVQLQRAVNDMVAAGVKVINHSVGWYSAAFYDGTGPLCDIINLANQNNILWVNAAGNDRNRHYMAMFNDVDGDLRHEFAPGQNYNTISLTAGVTLTLVMNWDAYPSTTQDYNLYLYNGNPDAGGVLVASSATRQGVSYSRPDEQIDYTPSASGTYYIVVKKYKSSTANMRFALYSWGPDIDIKTTSSSLVQPADCANAVAVGATDLNDTAEYFSAEGPTTDGRAKPDIAGPDRVKTSLSGLFAGTSAASPHIAGAAVLLRASNPVMSTAQIRNLMATSVKDVYTAGYDYRTGSGRISLDADLDGVIHDADNCPLVPNANQLDQDADGIGNACDNDIDGDGLLNTQEISLGTNPLVADTDGDGLTDGEEVNTYLTNPLLADTDGDGLTDGEEVTKYSTNPRVSDKGSLAPLGAADQVINLADLLVLMRFVEGLDLPSARDRILADMNSDGILDIRDSLLLRRRLGY